MKRFMANEDSTKKFELLGASVEPELARDWRDSLSALPRIMNGKKPSYRDWTRAVGKWWLSLPQTEQIAILSGDSHSYLVDYIETCCEKILLKLLESESSNISYAMRERAKLEVANQIVKQMPQVAYSKEKEEEPSPRQKAKQEQAQNEVD